MKNLLKLDYYFLFFFAATLISCDENDTNPEPEIPPVGSEGFFIINEGGWGNGNTSLSFYSKESGTVSNDLFYNANDQTPLGDQAQSMTIHDTLGYIVVQNSAKIEVIDINTYKSVATISEGLPSPRYFVAYSDTKGFVSDWGADGLSGTVKVIDLNNFTVSKTIETGQGSNQMLLIGNELFVTHSGGGFGGRDNQVIVIDADSEEITDSFELGDNPNSIQADTDGNLWVLTSGHTVYNADWSVDETNSTLAQLFKVSTTGDSLASYTMPQLGAATSLCISPNGETLYYLYSGGVYSLDYMATKLSASPLISDSFYGLSVDPVDGTIIGCESDSFEASGSINFFNTSGTSTGNHQVGIGPNSVTFK